MTVTITYCNGYTNDCDSTTGWIETRSGMTDPETTVTCDGDVIALQGTCTDAGNEYFYISYPDEGGATNLSINTTTYPKALVRWHTSAAAAPGMEAKIGFIFSDASQQLVTLGFSTVWKVTTITLTAGKTIDHIRLMIDDNPDSLDSGSYTVYFDWVLVCRGTFTLPHANTVKTKYERKKVDIEIPGRNGDIRQNLGMKSPKINIHVEILPGEVWQENADGSDIDLDYFIRGIIKDNWAYLTCDKPDIRCQVSYDDFSSDSSDGKFEFDLNFTMYKLGDYNTFLDTEWMYSTQ